MDFRRLSDLLNKHYGDLHWWPAETPEEVVIGAILTQNTSWSNVEKAILNLKKISVFSLSDIISQDPERIRMAIRPSGFYNQKTERLISVARNIEDHGGLEGLKKMPDQDLSRFLLSLKGVGRETGESIMIYALGRKKFVVDKYTLRIFSRTGITDDGTSMPQKLKDDIEDSMSISELNNFHGALVNLGKDFCRTKPTCNTCPIMAECDYAKDLTLP
ncbi:MAG: endonuclease [Candidatus Thermoplasmatota archaeon]|jgi:endonuclease-3 related protein|nr:endonuclease [Candidatus Thermoplasmatota archaeon]MCL5791127.1 endonuclease [Candidatus Thermoplasmatota archaeon]